MKYSGIIFDFNGVILWDSKWQDEAWQKTARDLTGREFSEKEMQDVVHGRTNKEALSYLLKKEIIGDELQKLTEKKEKCYRDIAINKPDFKLSPGAEELFNFLKTNKIPFNIATSSEKNNVEFFFKNLLLDRWFDINNIVYDDGKLPSKPAPDIYLKAAEKIELPPQRCIVIEDAISGITAAQNAGIGKIIALNSESKQKKFRAFSGVKRIITKLNQINIKDFES